MLLVNVISMELLCYGVLAHPSCTTRGACHPRIEYALGGSSPKTNRVTRPCDSEGKMDAGDEERSLNEARLAIKKMAFKMRKAIVSC